LLAVSDASAAPQTAADPLWLPPGMAAVVQPSCQNAKVVQVSDAGLHGARIGSSLPASEMLHMSAESRPVVARPVYPRLYVLP
jgi:hypothetical protein